MNIITIDCGASFIKFALFENEKLIITDNVAAPRVKTKTGASVFNTERIEALVDIVRNKLEDISSGLQEATICLDNEMHGCILAYADGTPYTDYLSWQIELISSDEVRGLLNAVFGETKASQIVMKTGMPLRSGLPSSTLLWMNRNGYLNSKEKLYFYTLGDYLIKRITGIEPLCHPTNAAATGLYDLETGNWNEEFISVLTDHAPIIFPHIGKNGFNYALGEKQFHILPAIGDQQAALLGSGFIGTNELSFNMGTGAQVSRLLDGTPQYGNYQIRPYFYGLYLRTIPHIPSGRAINVFFRFLKDICRKVDSSIEDSTVWKIMLEAATERSMNESEIRCDLSFFENAITDHTTASISNMTEYGFNLAMLIGSVFRQLKDNFIYVADKVNKGLPEYEIVIFSGGISKRWDILRNGIVQGLKTEATVRLSENDTLYGGMKYAVMDPCDR